jgi:pimeloyl-ACP methyl ester carboxylesterase
MRQLAYWFFLILLVCSSPAQAHARTRNVVLVHGSWHGAWAWHVTATMLESAGYNVYVPDLPAHGIDGTAPANVTLDSYVQKVTGILDGLSEPAVLVGHSMGGVILSQAGEMRPARVAKLVYLAAFMPVNGETMQSLLLQDAGSLVPSSVTVNTATMGIELIPDKVKALFYGETDARYVTLANMLLRADPLYPAVTPVTLTADNYGRLARYYIKTTNDMAISLAAQERMIERQPCRRVYPIESDHSPFFSHPQQLNAILQRILND